METQNLYILYKDHVSHNVFRVIGNIDFVDGKAVFKIPNGNTVKVAAENIVTIGVSGNVDLDQYRSKTEE